MKESLESKSLYVQGTDDFPVSKEVKDYFSGKGISIAYLREHYGFGKSLIIPPDSRIRNQIPSF